MRLFPNFLLVSFVFVFASSREIYFAPSIFLNHGGGPYPVMGEKENVFIAESLRNVSQIVDLKRLKAIIVVTAHREEDIVTISSAQNHDLLYDYYNFPPESYKYKYNAPGDPILAQKVFDALQQNGVPAKLDCVRGWDHGVFIPMMLINPSANIPVVQVSILKNQDAKQHYDIGKVLYQFREEGIAIFGSGMSYHNMRELNKYHPSDDNVVDNEAFDNFLNEVCTGDVLQRDRILLWTSAPQAFESHPLGEADHLMPLIVNAGAGGSSSGRNVFEGVFLKKFKLSGFMWDKE